MYLLYFFIIYFNIYRLNNIFKIKKKFLKINNLIQKIIKKNKK